VAIVADESTDIGKISQACVVLRYIHNSRVVERLVEFKDISGKGDANSLCKIFLQVKNNSYKAM
jgi:hypothetical protein